MDKHSDVQMIWLTDKGALQGGQSEANTHLRHPELGGSSVE